MLSYKLVNTLTAEHSSSAVQTGSVAVLRIQLLTKFANRQTDRPTDKTAGVESIRPVSECEGVYSVRVWWSFCECGVRVWWSFGVGMRMVWGRDVTSIVSPVRKLTQTQRLNFTVRNVPNCTVTNKHAILSKENISLWPETDVVEQDKCKEHQKEKLTIYCEEHNVLICHIQLLTKFGSIKPPGAHLFQLIANMIKLARGIIIKDKLPLGGGKF
ncbi:hypothetical protein DPMN_063200 [Dreissena polymorpha]|uniref:B box-type domain-containing protein n=1 Tax=Dreissena polymorpha TaxID=45954 RepID=A0A9D4HJX7_DREPO|nr:hypothetical protein DPMN_063200 [Dreissena polymorpha]